MSRRESSRDAKMKSKDSKDDSFVEQKEPKEKKKEKQEKQTKIDSLLSQVNKDEKEKKEPTISDLVTLIGALDIKFGKLASKDYIDQCLKKLVTEEALNSKLDELKEAVKQEVRKEMKEELDIVHEKLRKTKDNLKSYESDITDLKNHQSDLETKLEKVSEENVRLINKNKDLKSMIMDKDAQIKSQERQINDLDQYSRRNSIRMYGVSDKDRKESSEKTAQAVIKVLSDNLSMDVHPRDIDIAHRMGAFSVDGNRPIICKFVSRELKSKVLRARKMLKGKAMVIREDLSTRNAKLLENVSSKIEVTNAWSDEGRIIALLCNGNKIRVDLKTDLSNPLVPPRDMEIAVREQTRR